MITMCKKEDMRGIAVALKDMCTIRRLAGRGGRINSHPGNIQMRSMAEASRTDYFADSTPKLRKAFIGYEIVAKIRGMTPAGRWIKEDKDGTWWEIGDAKAVKKVEQAIREGKDGIDREPQVPDFPAPSQGIPASPVSSNNLVDSTLSAPVCLPVLRDDWYTVVQPPRHPPIGLGGYRISQAAAEKLKDTEMEPTKPPKLCMGKKFYATEEDIDELDNLSDLTGMSFNSGMSGGSQLSAPSIMKGICTIEDDSLRRETKSVAGQPPIPEDTPMETDSMEIFSYKSDHISLDLLHQPDRYASSTSRKVSSTLEETGDFTSKRVVIDDASITKSIFSLSALSLDDITMRSPVPQCLESANPRNPQYLHI